MFFHPQPILRNTHFIDKGLEYFEKYFLNYSKHFLRAPANLKAFLFWENQNSVSFT